ncbi:MAG: gliding motility-associated C-terminal domain-containing protein [Bacteroidota bacterium]
MVTSDVAGTYQITGDDTQTALTYGSSYTSTGHFLIANGSITISISDETTGNNCPLDPIVISPPPTCSNCTATALAQSNQNFDCTTSNVQLTGTASTEGIFNWTSPNGNQILNDPNPLVEEVGLYQLEVVFPNGCTAQDEVEVFDFPVPPIASAGMDQIIACDNAMVDLGGDNTTIGNNMLYVWEDELGQTIGDAPSIQVSTAGLYTFTVIDQNTNCLSTDEVLVADLPLAYFELTDDTLMITGTEDSYLFDLLNNDQFSAEVDHTILLNNPEQIGGITLLETGALLITSIGQLSTDFQLSYTVCPRECPEECQEANIQMIIATEQLFIPNAFSPNGDDKNERWIIPGLEEYENNQMIVINRWGAIVFRAAPYFNDWDGTGQSGRPLPEGTYYFLLHKDLLEEEPIKGAVTIIR